MKKKKNKKKKKKDDSPPPKNDLSREQHPPRRSGSVPAKTRNSESDHLIAKSAPFSKEPKKRSKGRK